MPTRPSAPTISSCTSRKPLANSPPPCCSAACSASSRWSSAGSSSLASLATPRSAAAAASRAARLRKFSKSACVRWARARYFAASSSARAASAARRLASGSGRRLLGRGDLRVGGGLVRPGDASGRGVLRDRGGLLLGARLVGHRCCRRRPRRRRPPPRLAGAVGGGAVAGRRSATAACSRLGALVHRLGDLVERGLQALGLGADVLGVLGGQRLADLLDRGLDLALGGVVDVLGEVLELLLGLVGRVLAGVAGLGQLAQALVLLGVRLGVADHPLDLVVGEAGAGLDLDLLLLARAEVLGRHVDDAVGVDVEADLDLRDAARRRRDAGELELAQRLVVGRHLALALQDVDLHARLVVLRGREDLGLAGRDRGVALDQLRHHAALGLDAEGERGDVEQQDVLDLAAQHAGLDGGADGHDLVRVDAAVRLLAGELLDLLLDGGHAGHAAHEHDVVDRPRRPCPWRRRWPGGPGRRRARSAAS